MGIGVILHIYNSTRRWWRGWYGGCGCVCVCVCLCVCVCVCVCMHMCTHACVCAHMHVCMCMHACMYYVSLCAHMWITEEILSLVSFLYLSIFDASFIHKYIYNPYTCLCVYLHARRCVYAASLPTLSVKDTSIILSVV